VGNVQRAEHAERADVVVVGAGVAGLACAGALTSAGREVVVLEARDRIGGRVNTMRTASGAVVELGAQVVHRTVVLDLDEVVRQAGLRTVPLARDAAVVVVDDGRRWGSAELMKERPPAPWVVEQWLGTVGSGTVAEALEGLPQAARRLAIAWLDQAIGGDSRTLDVLGVAAAREARSKGIEQVLVDGFDQVTRWLAGGLDVRLENPVNTVRWADDRVELRAAEPLRARAVVVTVPPSVVRAGGLRFEPPLSGVKFDSLPRLASCDTVSVVLCVSEAATRSAWVLLAEPPGGLWRTTVGSAVVVGHVKGPFAAQARDRPWTTEDATRVITKIDSHLGAVIDVELCDWGADPWARGAFPVSVAGADEASRRWAEPVGSVLFFAGDASVDSTVRGLVQGAISSGRRAASEVAEALGHG
jgi:monoamine oxidase